MEPVQPPEAEPHPDAPRRDDHPGEGAARGAGRMEAFADAVFAIAFTLPVVHIEMPTGREPLTTELLALWPAYLGYGLASLVIGIYWVHHHFSGAIYRTVGHWFNVATVTFLAAIGFIAFPVRVFSENLQHPEAQASAGLALTLCLAVTAVTWWIKWQTGRHWGHVDGRLAAAYVRRLNTRYNLATALALAAAALGFVRWEIGLGLVSLVTLFYLLPPPTPAYVEEAPIIEGEA
jgi:uncharacterized membrane protein